MAVVINEFEVVAEPQAAAPSSQEAKAQSPAGPTPADIERIMRRQLERLTRIWAH
jgi:hypothetical protein